LGPELNENGISCFIGYATKKNRVLGYSKHFGGYYYNDEIG
jgi:hypothetical protein